MSENKKYEKGTFGWLRKQQNIKAKKDGFDNVDKWLKWKSDPFNILEHKYGKEFAEWARQNKDKVPDKWINLGCKSAGEYNNKIAQRQGFDDHAKYVREWRHDNNINSPMSENENCASYQGVYIAEKIHARKILPLIFGGIEKEMPYGNPGFDYIVNGGFKVDIKSTRLANNTWNFAILNNDKADYFVLMGFNNPENEDDLVLLRVWVFKRDDMVVKRKGGKGYIIEKFYRRSSISIVNRSEDIIMFQKYEWTNKLYLDLI